MKQRDKPIPLIALIGLGIAYVLSSFVTVFIVTTVIDLFRSGKALTGEGAFWIFFFASLIAIGYWGYLKSFKEGDNSN